MYPKPYAESCEENKLPILAVLQEWFDRQGKVLEVGSGTGQHAVFFASQLRHLVWQASDVAEHLPGIQAWLDEAGLENLLLPLTLDVQQWSLHSPEYEYVFSANTVHIMSWPEVEKMFAGIGQVLKQDGRFCLYGPFNYNRCYTSESNARFDQWLKMRDPKSGIRDFEELDQLARQAGMRLSRDVEMPVNNRILVWERL